MGFIKKTHIVMDCSGCKGEINSLEAMRRMIVEIAQEACVVILNIYMHKFEPQGVTGAAVISESHITVHTWPEHHYAAVDVFTCGENALPKRAVQVVKKYIRPEKIDVKEIDRKS
jgi:S-adenosylmethionine decarboxylase